jgi:hypothetical protein
MDAPFSEEFPEEELVAAPGEPALRWSNFWPTLLQEANKMATPAIRKIRLIFSNSLINGGFQ